jgi:hypothetical protein
MSNYMVGKYVVVLDKGIKMINFDLLLGVILSQIYNYILSSIWFFATEFYCKFNFNNML